MDELILPAFPLPPSTNHAYTDLPFFKGGFKGMIRTFKDLMTHVGCRRVLSREGEHYKAAVSNQMNQTGYTTLLRDFIQQHVVVSVNIYVYRQKWLTIGGQPNRNAGDADNRVKLLQDVLFKCVGIDDCHAFHSGVTKLYGEDKVVVVFRKMPDEVDEL